MEKRRWGSALGALAPVARPLIGRRPRSRRRADADALDAGEPPLQLFTYKVGGKSPTWGKYSSISVGFGHPVFIHSGIPVRIRWRIRQRFTPSPASPIQIPIPTWIAAFIRRWRIKCVKLTIRLDVYTRVQSLFHLRVATFLHFYLFFNRTCRSVRALNFSEIIVDKLGFVLVIFSNFLTDWFNSELLVSVPPSSGRTGEESAFLAAVSSSLETSKSLRIPSGSEERRAQCAPGIQNCFGRLISAETRSENGHFGSASFEMELIIRCQLCYDDRYGVMVVRTWRCNYSLGWVETRVGFCFLFEWDGTMEGRVGGLIWPVLIGRNVSITIGKSVAFNGAESRQIGPKTNRSDNEWWCHGWWMSTGRVNPLHQSGARYRVMTNLHMGDQIGTVMLYGVPIVSLMMDSKERLCLAQISSTLLKDYSYNEIHNRRVALGITCAQCTPVQLELLRRAGAMPVTSRRCGMITRREAERLCKSFLGKWRHLSSLFYILQFVSWWYLLKPIFNHLGRVPLQPFQESLKNPSRIP